MKIIFERPIDFISGTVNVMDGINVWNELFANNYILYIYNQ